MLTTVKSKFCFSYSYLFESAKAELGFLMFDYYDNSDKLGVHSDEVYTLLLSSFPFVHNLFPCVTFVLS